MFYLICIYSLTDLRLVFQVVFLVKGPIYLVCISCTEEPYQSLKGQLELLYGQVSQIFFFFVSPFGSFDCLIFY